MESFFVSGCNLAKFSWGGANSGMAERGRIRTSGWLFTTATGKPATALANGDLSTF